MADLGPGPQRAADIADRLGVKVNSISPTRANLIKKGMIYSPEYGDLAFTVPLFDEFMLRAIPVFKKKA
jgi:Mn-dependent DtxR family transcriptional regulator